MPAEKPAEKKPKPAPVKKGPGAVTVLAFHQGQQIIGAFIDVNGIRQKVTTPTTLKLEPGTHQLRVQGKGHKLEQAFTVKPGAQVTLKLELK